DAVLARNGRIVAVGRAADMRDVGRGAHVLDAAGGTLTPGLTDAHIHFVPWARSRRQPDLSGARTRAAALARVAASLARLPAHDTPLVGRGWDESGWEAPPERGALDALAGERPVLVHRHAF